MLFLFGMISLATIAVAQKNKAVNGRLVDTLQKQQIEIATVSTVNAKDYSLAGFTRTDSEGRFSLSNLQPSTYRLSGSLTGFHPVWKDPGIGNAAATDLGE